MVIEEIHSYYVYKDKGTIFVEFTLCNDDTCNEHELEIPVEELEELCDLFCEREWLNDGDDDMEVMTIKNDVDELQLSEGLVEYINQNKGVLDY
jgi:hypothetical protein|tara:strand:- start:1041 stop:1322 length:282 start_codon:yes stop_codon:yes gene_type:complete